ncbi:secretin N-terminal domain-containing protein [Methylotenera sp. L2L1]|uniref:secretin N-terminal domain-containing protein n=1 Tax=Methylotenera sp. L2L1 TaxID=1502770 RepID=UPI0009DF3B07|nr:secretin N-terminal domain-containing protein [Methylotenera sp. L2L1]
MTFSNKVYSSQHTYRACFFVMVFMTQLSSCAFAPWEKSIDKLKTPEAQVAEMRKEASNHPEASIKRKNLLVTQELAATKLLVQAEQAKSKGLFTEAIGLYDRVLGFLPEDSGALNGKIAVEREVAQLKRLDQASQLIESNKLEVAREIVRDILIENSQHAKAIELQQQINQKSASTKSKPTELKPQFNKPVTLELRDVNIKVVFEALSRATGINFILDKDIKPETKATIFIKKARIEDAIEMVLSSNGLQKKVLSENTALVFPSTQAKLKDYQDLMIRSFYFSNTSAKQVSAMLKTMLKTKDIFVDERLNMLVMRDTPDVIRIAEKLVAANDLEEPEVMLDIEVLEISRSRLQELGVDFPNRISVNSLIPITTVTSATGVLASSTVNTSTQLTLEGLMNLNKGRLDVSPNPAVNFRKVTGDVNLLSNPRIRVKNNEKAKILVGDKVPIITTTSTANVGISENVQYVDVGLKLDVEPRITLNNFVNIKIGLEVSSLGEKTTTKNGATVYTIGTRNASTVLRLKNGETQILAGLILDDERKSASKLPGLGDIPLLGRLFSNQEDKKSKTEIVLAITPRVIGNVNLPQAEVSEYWSGTENLITDKPQSVMPTGSGALTPKEQFRERIRQQQLKANPDGQPEASLATEQEPAQDIQNVESGTVEGLALPGTADNVQSAVESVAPPATSPAAP